jgi:hypothetical protein
MYFKCYRKIVLHGIYKINVFTYIFVVEYWIWLSSEVLVVSLVCVWYRGLLSTGCKLCTTGFKMLISIVHGNLQYYFKYLVVMFCVSCFNLHHILI